MALPWPLRHRLTVTSTAGTANSWHQLQGLRPWRPRDCQESLEGLLCQGMPCCSPMSLDDLQHSCMPWASTTVALLSSGMKVMSC